MVSEVDTAKDKPTDVYKQIDEYYYSMLLNMQTALTIPPMIAASVVLYGFMRIIEPRNPSLIPTDFSTFEHIVYCSGFTTITTAIGNFVTGMPLEELRMEMEHFHRGRFSKDSFIQNVSDKFFYNLGAILADPATDFSQLWWQNDKNLGNQIFIFIRDLCELYYFGQANSSLIRQRRRES